MAKLIGINKVKISIFISGAGSNLLNLIKHSKKRNSNYTIKIIFSDNKEAAGLEYAKKYKIPFKVLNYRNKIKAEERSLKLLNTYKVKIVCLAGYMRILSSYFIKNFKGKILNIHPSLLPKYKGLNTHYRAIKNKEKYSGCTVHFVNKKLDSGKIILQKKLKISLKENVKSLEKKILKIEHRIYPKAVEKVLINF